MSIKSSLYRKEGSLLTLQSLHTSFGSCNISSSYPLISATIQTMLINQNFLVMEYMYKSEVMSSAATTSKVIPDEKRKNRVKQSLVRARSADRPKRRGLWAGMLILRPKESDPYEPRSRLKCHTIEFSPFQ
ncbi:hypothetical protein PanWU01x14_110610 [Parasponia andersonii]|uniref:Uncharacterized protein n=1 Tax=Parasponia andersonii TaxID=3476 RepID=A0A2P5CZE1_PARAD|nr:hypothetical protein PanWU01x14_110610 [Parasponia andersonii]